MSNIGPNTNVYIFFHDPRHGRIWVQDTELILNQRGEKVLKPLLDDDPRYAKSWRYDIAVIAARRFKSEGVLNPHLYQACFTLSPSNSAEEIASASTTSAPDKDDRVVMQYKGVLVRPYIPRGWCVHLFDGPRQLESVKGETVEEAVDKVIERNQLQFAEKYTQPEPEPVAPSAPASPTAKHYEGHRVRPGSLK
jgi:hypothetical protein